MRNFPIYLFNHGSLLGYLSKAATSPLPKSKLTIAELAITPYLAHFAGLQTPDNFPGIAAALNPQTSLRELAIKIPDCPHSLILAPGERLSPKAISDAWQELGEDSGDSLIGLLSLPEAATLLPQIELENPVTLFWDVDSPPTGDFSWLDALSNYLRVRTPNSVWQGIHLYSGSRATAVMEDDVESYPAFLRGLSETIQRLNPSQVTSETHATS